MAADSLLVEGVINSRLSLCLHVFDTVSRSRTILSTRRRCKTQPSSSSLHEQTSSTLMSHAASSSSPNFQLIFNNALRAYEKNTKSDLLAHPLAAQLQACDSPSAILLVLQEQARELNESEKLTKWLDPTVNVLYALSGALGEGVGLVYFNT